MPLSYIFSDIYHYNVRGIILFTYNYYIGVIQMSIRTKNLNDLQNLLQTIQDNRSMITSFLSGDVNKTIKHAMLKKYITDHKQLSFIQAFTPLYSWVFENMTEVSASADLAKFNDEIDVFLEVIVADYHPIIHEIIAELMGIVATAAKLRSTSQRSFLRMLGIRPKAKDDDTIVMESESVNETVGTVVQLRAVDKPVTVTGVVEDLVVNDAAFKKSVDIRSIPTSLTGSETLSIPSALYSVIMKEIDELENTVFRKYQTDICELIFMRLAENNGLITNMPVVNLSVSGFESVVDNAIDHLLAIDGVNKKILLGSMYNGYKSEDSVTAFDIKLMQSVLASILVNKVVIVDAGYPTEIEINLSKGKMVYIGYPGTNLTGGMENVVNVSTNGLVTLLDNAVPGWCYDVNLVDLNNDNAPYLLRLNVIKESNETTITQVNPEAKELVIDGTDYVRFIDSIQAYLVAHGFASTPVAGMEDIFTYVDIIFNATDGNGRLLFSDGKPNLGMMSPKDIDLLSLSIFQPILPTITTDQLGSLLYFITHHQHVHVLKGESAVINDLDAIKKTFGIGSIRIA